MSSAGHNEACAVRQCYFHPYMKVATHKLRRALPVGIFALIVSTILPPLLVHLLIRATGVHTGYYIYSVSYDCNYCNKNHNLNTQFASFFFYYGTSILSAIVFAVGYSLSGHNTFYKPARLMISIALLLSLAFSGGIFLLQVPLNFDRVLWAVTHSLSYAVQTMVICALAVLGGIRVWKVAQYHHFPLLHSAATCFIGWLGYAFLSMALRR